MVSFVFWDYRKVIEFIQHFLNAAGCEPRVASLIFQNEKKSTHFENHILKFPQMENQFYYQETS